MSTDVSGPISLDSRPAASADSVPYVPPANPDRPDAPAVAQVGKAAAIAVALGWQLADFNELALRPSQPDEGGKARPATASTMWDRATQSDGERAALDLQLIRRSMTQLVRLMQVPEVAGLISADSTSRTGRDPLIDVHLDELAKLVDDEVWRKDGTRACFLSESLLKRLNHDLPKIHAVAMQCLFTADVRLGKAYLAGGQLRSLCGDLSVWTSDDASDEAVASHTDRADRNWFEVERRLARVQDLIVALKGALPDSAAHPVSRSIQTWRLWLLAQPVDSGFIWPSEDDKAIARLFRTQAHRWRTLLTGEASGQQLLTIESVAEIGCEVLKRVRGSLRKLLVAITPVVLPILIAGAGVVALAWHFASGTAVSTTALGTLLTVLGASWKAASPVRQRLMSSVDLHQEQLFQADVDNAVATAITLLPPRSAKQPLLGLGRTRARRGLVQVARTHGWDPA